MANNKFIYMDNAATTRVSDEVLSVMLPYFSEEFGNPSSIYTLGRRASLAIEQARDSIAAKIGARPKEIFFTSGGSEADNWAIKSAAKLAASKGKKHIISTAIEHHAVLHTLDSLKKDGYDITILPVDEFGIVSVEDVKKAITPETGLVTVMYANNEIGTIQPIREIGKLCKESGVFFHTDAVQALGQIEINVDKDNIDLLSASGHKIHGPKGIGFLYVRSGIRLANFIDGGAQERGKRGGTESVPAIVGLAKAVETATSNIPEKTERMRKQTRRIINELTKVSHSRLNGHLDLRLSSNVNISFEGVEGESILLMLDNVGIAASSGSACTSGSLDPSHVLLAIGLIHEVAHGSLRVTIGDDTTDEDIDYLIEQVPIVIEKLRAMSPLWDHIINNK